MAKRAAERAAEAAEDAAAAAHVAARAAKAEAADGDEAKKLGPLFSLHGEKSERHDRTQIFRLEPIDEGHVGDLQVDATLDDIRRKWGGGRFRAVAVDASGEYLQRDSRISIAGDPVFDNDVAQRRYAKWLEQQFGKAAAPAGPTPDVDAADVKHRRDLERIRLEVEAKEAAEDRRRARERDDREAERQRIADERKAERIEREAAEDRRWREKLELEERRSREEREERARERIEREAAEERRWKAEQEERRADREHRQDPTEVLMKGMQIAMQLGGGGGEGYPDAATAFIAKMPEILAGAKDVVSTARESNPNVNGHTRGASEKVELEGPLADDAKRTAAILKKRGVKNPQAVMAAAMQRTFRGLAAEAAKNGATKPKAQPPALPPVSKAKRVARAKRKGKP